MRFTSLLWKSLVETFRDWKILILTLLFAPMFVVLMKFYYDESSRNPYRVTLVNDDRGATDAQLGTIRAGEELAAALAGAADGEGKPLFDLSLEEDLDEACGSLEQGEVDLVVHLPANFSAGLAAAGHGQVADPVVVATYGDVSNANYLMAAVWNDMLAYEYATAWLDLPIPLQIEAHTLTGAQALNEYELYIPALLGMALMMLLFTGAAALIREKDKGTIVRLRLANMTTFEWLSAVSLTQVLVGLLALAVAYLTAVALGYQPAGSFTPVLVIGLVASLSVIGISILVAAYLRTIFDLLTIGCFPFFILMFFSGGMLPLPPIRLFTIAGRSIQLNEILPTTHAITAMHKTLNNNLTLAEIGYELGAMALLAVVYFALGVALFTRKHMQARA